jgi:peptide-methionine (S)-S-oxide reductase
MSSSIESIVVAGGCFWCLEPAFRSLNGIISVTCGYTGGNTESPSYDEICQGDTGHAEAVRVDFESSVISLPTLLDVFFAVHNPTTLNRQGADVGTQYRSAIFFKNGWEKKCAEDAIARTNESGTWNSPIVTTLEPLVHFYEAESYHQSYFTKNPESAYCAMSIPPKLKKIRSSFGHLQKQA